MYRGAAEKPLFFGVLLGSAKDLPECNLEATMAQRRTLTSLVDPQCAPPQFHAVDRVDGILGRCVFHSDEAKAARTSRVAVVNQFDGVNRAMSREQIPNFVLCDAERKVTDVDRLHHCNTPFDIYEGLAQSVHP